MDNLSVQPLSAGSLWAAQMAAEQFAYWGPLTGHASAALYEAFLDQAARSVTLPRVLVAAGAGGVLGSVNLMTREMAIRPQLTPWLGQLFVGEGHRANGVGGRLVEAAIAYVAGLGYDRLFLFTSGSLPDYYRKRGWVDVETVDYLGKSRVVMRFDIPGGAAS
jgi:predicted N-acetyltransferase YhbS